MLFATIRTFGSDALSGGSQISLLTTTAVCVFIGVAFYRIPWRDYEIAITNNVAGVTSAIIILLIIGALSGVWMISGVVPTLIYYGMQIIHPDFFLTSTCVICALVSIMTGSSWTTIATIGILTGGEVISEEKGMRLEETSIPQLGSAKKVKVTKDATIIVDGMGEAEIIKGRVTAIKNQIAETTSDYDKEKLQERLAKLSGGVAVIKVGAATETEMKDKKLRIEDALNATRAGVEDVPS